MFLGQVKEEKQLSGQMLEAGKSMRVIVDSLGQSVESVKIKIKRLGLKVVVPQKFSTTTTNSNEDLPSVEEALKFLAGASDPLCKGFTTVVVQHGNVYSYYRKYPFLRF